MPRPASSIISAATQIAKCPNYITQATAELNSLLHHIALTVDFSAARGRWDFTFATNLTSAGGGGIISAAPNPLPIDYLRVPVSVGSTGAQRSSKWYFQGVAYDMIELDLTEWDDQVQQAGIQSYPYFWAKDMAGYQPVIEVTGDLVANSTSVATLTALDTGSSLDAILANMSIAGGIGPISCIPPGTTISALTGGSPPTGLTLSAAPTVSMTGATLLIGNPGNGYPYPPPSGAYPVMIRYQRMMPRLTLAQINSGAYCWFTDDEALVEGLAGLMMRYTGDDRVQEYIGGGLASGSGRFGARMAQYTKLADDNANRAQTVQLDRRRFGGSFARLPNTKTVGW